MLDKTKANDTLSIRKRDEEDEVRGTKVDDVIANMKAEVESKIWEKPKPKPKWGKAKNKEQKNAKQGKSKGAVNQRTLVFIPKCDIRVGKIVKVWNHPESENFSAKKLMLGRMRHGKSPAVCGHITRLSKCRIGMVLTVCNLKAAKLANFKSHGMVLCAKSEDGVVEFVDPPAGSKPGDRVVAEGHEGPAATPAAMKKKKIWPAMAVDLKTNADRVATYKGVPLKVGDVGVCVAPSVVNGPIN